LSLPSAIDVDLYKADESIIRNLVLLPDTLDKAIELAKNSNFIRNVIGDELLLKYLSIKEEEASEAEQARDKDDFYREKYFTII